MIAALGLLITLTAGALLWAGLKKEDEMPALLRNRWVNEATPVIVVLGLTVGLALLVKGLL